MITKLKQKYADEIKSEIESSFIENGFDVSIRITKQYFTHINRINYEFLIYKDDFTIANIRCLFNLLTRERTWSIKMGECDRFAFKKSGKKTIFMDEYIINDILKTNEMSFINIKTKMAVLEKIYVHSKEDVYKKEILDDRNLVSKWECAYYDASLNMSNSILYIKKTKHKIKNFFDANNYSFEDEPEVEYYSIKLDLDKMKDFPNYKLAFSSIISYTGDFEEYYKLCGSDLDLLYLFDEFIISSLKSYSVKVKFFEFITIETDNNESSKKKDAVIEDLEYIVNSNASEPIKQKAIEMIDRYNNKIESSRRDKKQRKIDEEAMNILETVDRFYLREEDDIV